MWAIDTITIWLGEWELARKDGKEWNLNNYDAILERYYMVLRGEARQPYDPAENASEFYN
jgi:hypothetical protein